MGGRSTPEADDLRGALHNLKNVVESWLAQSVIPPFVTIGSRVSFAALGADVDRAADAVLLERASRWRNTGAECPPEGRKVLGIWGGSHILCEWSADGDGRIWWVDGSYHEGLTESGGPDRWMPLPEPPK